MRYLLLPFHLIKFWYVEGLATFLRSWRHLILFLEEDLAVGLMWRLLFVPLFHDSSIVGRILSFFFRVSRIFTGLFAFAIATSIFFLLAIYWFTLPVLIFIGPFLPSFRFMPPQILNLSVYLTGVGLFIIHIVTHPHKEVWQIKNDSQIWEASWVSSENVTWDKLLKSDQTQLLLSYLELTQPPVAATQISDMQSVVRTAFELAKKTGSLYIGPEHFFVSMIKNTPNIDNLLVSQNLEEADFEKALSYLEQRKTKWRVVNIWDDDFSVHHLKGTNRGWLGVPTPNLDSVSRDLTREAAKYGFEEFVGRSSTVSEIMNIFSQEGGRNVVLVAPPGAGKSLLMQNLASQIISGDAPASVATKRLVLLDTTRLLSGIKSEGELADRIKIIFDETAASGNIIICVEEIQDLGLGEAGSAFNLYSLLLPYIESGGFQFMATTEPENYTSVLEKNGAFARLFTKIELPLASKDETILILIEKAIEIERKSKIRVSFMSMKKAVELSDRLIHDRVLPDSAIAVLREAETRSTNGWITAKTIEEVVGQRVNVPVVELGNTGKEKLLNLEDEIHQRMIDQEEAVKAIADTLRRSATGLREESRPIGSFLFVGPTGVGKTELAKTLSEVYFKGGGAFIRFDMSEYQDSASVSRLIGGTGQSGELTEAIRGKPYALLLLDEFEKANPAILTLFLQVLDDGRLTDGTGKTVDFTNSIIIATSNAGSLMIADGLKNGQSVDTLKPQVQQELLKEFKPELVNRFDDIVIFKPLSETDLEKIVRLKLDILKNQMKEKGFLIEFDEALVPEIGKRGFDPVLGARPMRRLLQDTLESNLSKLILENKLQKGQTQKVGVELLG